MAMLDLHRRSAQAIGLPIRFTEPERKEALVAMRAQAKRWRTSLRSMERDGRDDEAAALGERLDALDSVRWKLGGEVPPEEEETTTCDG